VFTVNGVKNQYQVWRFVWDYWLNCVCVKQGRLCHPSTKEVTIGSTSNNDNDDNNNNNNDKQQQGHKDISVELTRVPGPCRPSMDTITTTTVQKTVTRFEQRHRIKPEDSR